MTRAAVNRAQKRNKEMVSRRNSVLASSRLWRLRWRAASTLRHCQLPTATPQKWPTTKRKRASKQVIDGRAWNILGPPVRMPIRPRAQSVHSSARRSALNLVLGTKSTETNTNGRALRLFEESLDLSCLCLCLFLISLASLSSVSVDRAGLTFKLALDYLRDRVELDV